MKRFGLVSKMMLLSAGFAVCAALFLSACGSSDSGSLVIRGTINQITTTSLLRVDGVTTEPVVGAVVRGLGKTSVSNQNGQFNLNGDPGGVPSETLLDITIDGKRTLITVPTDGNAPFDLSLLLRQNGDIAVNVDEMDILPDPECSDGEDNDNDGAIDFPDDIDCDDANDTTEDDPIEIPGTTQCNDGVDNDADGLTDFGGDPGCDNAMDNDESNNPQCSDTIDNDFDGAIDFPDDPGCTDVNDNDEAAPQCSDGLDNDGDMLIDFPQDIGCTDRNDSDETNALPQCDDGIDNDGDGRIDFGDDPGCDDANDDDETDAPASPTPTPAPTVTPTPVPADDCSESELVCGDGSAPTCLSDCFCNDGFPIGDCSAVCFDTMNAPTQCGSSGLGCGDGSSLGCPF